MKILYIGTPDTYRFYRRGMNPSHWLYGAVEMEYNRHEVIWEREAFNFWNDWKMVKQYRPDTIFIPNLNLHNHLLLLLLSGMGILHRPVYAWLHHEPKIKKGLSAMFFRLLLSGCNHLFFLSEKTMQKTIASGLIGASKCSVPGWGPDKVFYSKVQKNDGKWFVSTGKENRDFNILIEAFRRTGAPLKIITAQSHAGNDYGDLKEKCLNIKNIEVVITENSGRVYPQMLKAMAEAKALVCPLLKDKLNYCVGLSTIADAIGLDKPLIITHNPYHDISYLDGAKIVETVDDWVKAIEEVMEHADKSTIISEMNMTSCYQNMKKKMKL